MKASVGRCEEPERTDAVAEDTPARKGIVPDLEAFEDGGGLAPDEADDREEGGGHEDDPVVTVFPAPPERRKGDREPSSTGAGQRKRREAGEGKGPPAVVGYNRECCGFAHIFGIEEEATGVLDDEVALGVGADSVGELIERNQGIGGDSKAKADVDTIEISEPRSQEEQASVEHIVPPDIEASIEVRGPGQRDRGPYYEQGHP
jgi:hypothetical protein